MKKLLNILFTVLALSMASSSVRGETPGATDAAWLERAATSTVTLAVCKGADVATTVVALHSGRGVEANPLVKPLVSGIKAGTGLNMAAVLPLVAVSAAFVALIHWIDSPPTTAVTNVITCGVAAHNALLIFR